MTLLILSDSNVVTRVALWSLVPSAIAFVFVVFVFYRSRREAIIRQKEAELKQQLAEVEMKALRAQMNPHFIFNCLNSIYRFLEKQDTVQAGDYLLKFSHLIRTVLENSLYREVTLHDDLEALHLYMQMEQMRMNNRFDYTVSVDAQLDISTLYVPPLIIQPFVENAIWHGLNDKKDRGTLRIVISKTGEMIKYLVEDNGENKTGSALQIHHASKKKSLGITITRERLEMLNKAKNTKAGFKISDIEDAHGNYNGKRVELWIPIQEGD